MGSLDSLVGVKCNGPRIPSLDGLRAISIAIVMFSHALGTRYFLERQLITNVTGDLGWFGVRCFFLISGFLITSLLLQELDARGNISLARFYLRRGFRIFPAFYCFLLLLLLAVTLGLVKLKPGEWSCAATYTINYLPKRSWAITHIWSLAVEEHFYLLWPLALCLFGKRKGLWLAVIAVLVVPWLRFLTWKWFPEHRAQIRWETHTVCDALAMGCLLAGFREWLHKLRLYQLICTPSVAIAAAMGALCLNAISYRRDTLTYLISPSLMNLAIALFIDIAISYPNSRLGKCLNWKPLVVVGILSYSLYLWQQVFLCNSSRWWQAFPVNLLLAFVAAWLSYRFVEKPFLRLRKYIEFKLPPPADNEKVATAK